MHARNRRLYLLPLIISFAGSLVFLPPSYPKTLKDIEQKVRRNAPARDSGSGTKGTCLLKVTKKTTVSTTWKVSKYYYVVYHCDNEKPLTIEFVARNKKGDQFNLQESGVTSGEDGGQWDWEKYKGYLPKYFSKTKVGRRVTKFIQSKDMIDKYGLIQAYMVTLKTGNTVIDTIKWNWDEMVTYEHGAKNGAPSNHK